MFVLYIPTWRLPGPNVSLFVQPLISEITDLHTYSIKNCVSRADLLVYLPVLSNRVIDTAPPFIISCFISSE